MLSNLLANARAIWAQNSTAIPVAMTRFTNETAFNEMSHTTMIPIRFKIINDIVNATQNPAASPFSGFKTVSRKRIARVVPSIENPFLT